MLWHVEKVQTPGLLGRPGRRRIGRRRSQSHRPGETLAAGLVQETIRRLITSSSLHSYIFHHFFFHTMNTRSAARCRWRRILPKTRRDIVFCFAFFDGCALGNKKLCSYRHCRKEPEGLWYFDGKTRVGWREGLYFQPVAINEPWQQKHKGPCGVLWRVVCRDGTGSGGPKIKRQRPSVWLRRRTRFRSLSLSVD